MSRSWNDWLQTRPTDELRAAVRIERRLCREEAYRRALRHAGYTPGSVDIMVDRDRDWIQFDVEDER